MLEKSILAGSNKRRRKRYSYENSVLCYKNFNESKSKIDIVPFRVTIKDISYSGIGVICQKNIKENSFLEFNLNNRYDIRKMIFKVKWNRHSEDGYKCGLEFVDLTAEDIFFINDIIEDIKRKENRRKSKFT